MRNNKTPSKPLRHPARLSPLTAALLLGLGSLASTGVSAAGVVISQVYGGGGNSGATLKNDFIELFNAGGTAVNLNGWTVHYASATGSTWNNKTTLGNLTLQAGQYLLIEQDEQYGRDPFDCLAASRDHLVELGYGNLL